MQPFGADIPHSTSKQQRQGEPMMIEGINPALCLPRNFSYLSIGEPKQDSRRLGRHSLADPGSMRSLMISIPEKGWKTKNPGLRLDSVQRSLSQGNTPLGSPELLSSHSRERQKKSVHFADSLGLDLVDVKLILDYDKPPVIPKKVLSALNTSRPRTPSYDDAFPGHRFLGSCFRPLGNDPDFLGRVWEQALCLETAVVAGMTVLCSVRVRNLDYHKKVYARFSFDGWKTCEEIEASYVYGSCDGTTDKFSFTITSPPGDFPVGSKIEFAIRYEIPGNSFWDNNQGKNYVFECNCKEPVEEPLLQDRYRSYLV
ncbi:glycogen-binding subunit 76A-like [Branchiostoma floridae]|uniref:Glycogen-binding subunit 76A-like n=1 Tax=Branchiostoma floridae TaxID=7739 RepID=A0A9J7LCA0_BRAFL|nr:glycogen-binding subunit 76A-like [Branchiostoma floridae]